LANETIEIGVAYSQEEEMAGRLHDEMERMRSAKKASSDALAASAA
jgi:hypothetical protein